jgi:hypothetical protein
MKKLHQKEDGSTTKIFGCPLLEYHNTLISGNRIFSSHGTIHDIKVTDTVTLKSKDNSLLFDSYLINMIIIFYQ